MARLPNLAVKASKAQIVYPRLPKDPVHLSFAQFLKDTYAGGQQNKVAIGLAEKTKIDEEFKSRLIQLHGHNEKLCTTKLQEVSSPAAMALWDCVKKSAEIYLGATTTELLSVGTEQLKLPGVGMSVKAKNCKGDCWNFQTYEEFAKKTEKMNRDVTFKKKLMDDSFQRAVSLVTSNITRKSTKGARNVSSINQMLARCLGPESDKYWEGRE